MNWHLASTVGDAYDTGGGLWILIHGCTAACPTPRILHSYLFYGVAPDLAPLFNSVVARHGG